MYWIFRTAGQNDEVAGTLLLQYCWDRKLSLRDGGKPTTFQSIQGGHVKFITAKASLQRNALFKVMKELRLDLRVIVLLKEKGD